MIKRVILESVPKPFGPYSHAVIVNGIAYITAQIATDPETGGVFLGSIQAEIKVIMENLKSNLKELNSSLDNVIKTNLAITEGDDFDLVCDVYGEYFGDNQPAIRTTIVKSLPHSANISVDIMALVEE